MNKYVITGKKWFDKVNGNTYHSVNVISVESNEQIIYIPFNYGYGEQWKQTAYDELIKLKLVKATDRFNHELNRKRFIYIDCSYGLKRDL